MNSDENFLIVNNFTGFLSVIAVSKDAEMKFFENQNKTTEENSQMEETQDQEQEGEKDKGKYSEQPTSTSGNQGKKILDLEFDAQLYGPVYDFNYFITTSKASGLAKKGLEDPEAVDMEEIPTVVILCLTSKGYVIIFKVRLDELNIIETSFEQVLTDVETINKVSLLLTICPKNKFVAVYSINQKTSRGDKIQIFELQKAAITNQPPNSEKHQLPRLGLLKKRAEFVLGQLSRIAEIFYSIKFGDYHSNKLTLLGLTFSLTEKSELRCFNFDFFVDIIQESVSLNKKLHIISPYRLSKTEEGFVCAGRNNRYVKIEFVN